MPSTTFNIAKLKAAEGDLDWETADVRALLLKDGAYAVDPDDNFVADVIAGAAEYAGTNYVRAALANQTADRDDVSNWTICHADAVVWADLGEDDLSDGDVDAAVLYVHVTNDADSWLIGHIPITGTPNGTDATLAEPADGWLRFI